MRISDWSSNVCSSDLTFTFQDQLRPVRVLGRRIGVAAEHACCEESACRPHAAQNKDQCRQQDPFLAPATFFLRRLIVAHSRILLWTTRDFPVVLFRSCLSSRTPSRDRKSVG